MSLPNTLSSSGYPHLWRQGLWWPGILSCGPLLVGFFILGGSPSTTLLPFRSVYREKNCFSAILKQLRPNFAILSIAKKSAITIECAAGVEWGTSDVWLTKGSLKYISLRWSRVNQRFLKGSVCCGGEPGIFTGGENPLLVMTGKCSITVLLVHLI